MLSIALATVPIDHAVVLSIALTTVPIYLYFGSVSFIYLGIGFYMGYVGYHLPEYLGNSDQQLVISIDGNIGSGKSTFIKLLQEHLDQKEVEFAPEPVDVWTSVSEKDGKNLLQLFYENKERWSYTFQNFAYITRMMALEKAKTSGKRLIISERSVLTDRNVFAKMLHESGAISDMEKQIYHYWYNYFDTNITHTIYLKTSVENCLKRIKTRAREEESSISEDYLQDLENNHDRWLLKDKNSTMLDGNSNFVDNPDELAKLLGEFNKCLENLLS